MRLWQEEVTRRILSSVEQNKTNGSDIAGGGGPEAPLAAVLGGAEDEPYGPPAAACVSYGLTLTPPPSGGGPNPVRDGEGSRGTMPPPIGTGGGGLVVLAATAYGESYIAGPFHLLSS